MISRRKSLLFLMYLLQIFSIFPFTRENIFINPIKKVSISNHKIPNSKIQILYIILLILNILNSRIPKIFHPFLTLRVNFPFNPPIPLLNRRNFTKITLFLLQTKLSMRLILQNRIQLKLQKLKITMLKSSILLRLQKTLSHITHIPTIQLTPLPPIIISAWFSVFESIILVLLALGYLFRFFEYDNFDIFLSHIGNLWYFIKKI